mmetsp:Transcript_5577/g.7898  ORF Transcript_5577/g.7898 Transcript_5577/m.7898 type:complete len:80 (-) Transcript_5577:22-261(-)
MHSDLASMHLVFDLSENETGVLAARNLWPGGVVASWRFFEPQHANSLISLVIGDLPRKYILEYEGPPVMRIPPTLIVRR